MKTLLYLASGEYYPEYDTLPFDRLIFVDRNIGFAKSYPKNDPRIRFIPADALIAIDMLKKEGVKIDCLVSVNEGLYAYSAQIDPPIPRQIDPLKLSA